MNLIIGASGRLGHKLVSFFGPTETIRVDRSTYMHWTSDSTVGAIASFIESNKAQKVYVAAGVIDPAQNSAEHEMINVTLPLNIVKASSSLGCKVVTFGTILEHFVSADVANPYLRSKKRLSERLSELAASGRSVLHLQLHTLYGGTRPPPFMFLGQLISAIERGTDFRMSCGDQLREYHHLDDEVPAIVRMANADLVGVVDLSHGECVLLRDLAKYILEYFRCSHLLKLGVLPTPAEDNYSRKFAKHSIIGDSQFRDTFGGTYKYIARCLNQ